MITESTEDPGREPEPRADRPEPGADVASVVVSDAAIADFARSLVSLDSTGRTGLPGLALLVTFLLSPILLYFGSSAAGQLDDVAVWNAGMSLLWLGTLHLLVRRTLWLHIGLLPLYATTATDLFLIWRFESRLTCSYVSMILIETESAGDFLSAFAGDVAVMTVSTLAVLSAGLWGVRRMEIRSRPLVRIVAVVLLVAGYGAAIQRQVAAGLTVPRASLDVAAHDFSAPVGAVSQFVVSAALLAETKEHLAVRTAFSFNATREDAGRREIYVVVVGESARPDHFSLNGYERETSPRLARVEGLVSFTDLLTTAPKTSIAVPSMLSLASIEDWAGIERERSIVSAFRETGFDTHWVSIQEVSHWGGIIVHVANEAEHVRYRERALDGELVSDLRRIIAEAPPEKSLLVVFHTKGSHFEFSDRYPSEFARFDEDAPTRKERLVNSYDNSILYTDHVLAELIAVLEEQQTDTLLLYASDHGENLMDDERRLFGHSVGTEHDLRTAAFLWASEALRARRASGFRRAIARAGAPLSLADVSHSLLDVAGIDARGLDHGRSIFSDDFKVHRRLFRNRGELFEYEDGTVSPLD